jgi:thioredoxin reductase (NADPH)
VVEPVAIVGAGPTGLACAVELGNRGIAAVCYDRGSILDSIYHFPEEMRWYSTRDLLDIAGIPFSVPEPHPTRLEALAYYRGIAEKFGVQVIPETRIVAIRPQSSASALARATGDALPARTGTLEISVFGRKGPLEFVASAAVLATGFFHNPKKLRVPGDDLPHVHSRFVSAFPFHGRSVVVVGGKNSAAEAALDLYRHGARVTLLVRAPAISERVKYWIKPDLENRIRAGKIRALFQTRVLEITPEFVRVLTPAGEEAISADAVFPLVGYEPDFALFEACGVALEGERRIPAHDPETLESNVPNLFLAGAILGGTEIGQIFIENSRDHAGRIASAIEKRRRLVTA